MASTSFFSPKVQSTTQSFARAKNSQQAKKVVRNLPQIPSLKMNHLSPANATNASSIVTPTGANVRGGMQSLTIETGAHA